MIPPKVVILDISCESHEEVVECVDDLEYAIKTYGNDPCYAIYIHKQEEKK